MADYYLGSQSEDMVGEGDHWTYRPGGVLHAVEAKAVPHDTTMVLAYAVCGTPVRVWREEGFDPASELAHQGCVRLVEDGD